MTDATCNWPRKNKANFRRPITWRWHRQSLPPRKRGMPVVLTAETAVLLMGARAHATNCAKQTQFRDGPREG